MRGQSIWWIILVIIILLGIWWWSAGRGGTSTDTAADVLNSLEQKTGIAFSALQDTQFQWMTENEGDIDQVFVEGKYFDADGLTDEEGQSVGTALENLGFEVDMYNISDGTIVGLVGYQKGNMVCTVTGGVSGGAEGIDADPVVYFSEVECGLLEVEV